MLERHFWQHLPTQRVWAVETDGQKPVKCVGPLNERDVDEVLLPYLDFSTRYIDDVKIDWSLYVQYVFCSACSKVLRFGATTAANGPTGRVHLACSLKPPATEGGSVGAALLVESLWQISARLRLTSGVLRRSSDRLQARCRFSRATYALSLAH